MEGSGRQPSDLMTVAAISIVAYIIQNVLHEGLGHGGACAALGGDPVAVSTAYFDCGTEGLDFSAHRLIAAAGSIVNVVTGLGCLLLLRRATLGGDSVRFFVWLSMAVNLLTGTGYLLFSGALSVGDWVVVVEGLQPVWLWRLLLIGAGALLYLACIWILLVELNKLLGESDDRIRQAAGHSVVPFVTGSSTSTIGAVLNPMSPLLILMSAASSFGGTSALAWMTQLFKTSRFGPVPGPTLSVERSWVWISASLLLLLGHIFILGSSVEF